MESTDNDFDRALKGIPRRQRHTHLDESLRSIGKQENGTYPMEILKISNAIGPTYALHYEVQMTYGLVKHRERY